MNFSPEFHHTLNALLAKISVTNEEKLIITLRGILVQIAQAEAHEKLNESLFIAQIPLTIHISPDRAPDGTFVINAVSVKIDLAMR